MQNNEPFDCNDHLLEAVRVTVEGVEAAKQAAFLDKANGDHAQGLFFGRLVPASEVSANIPADFRL